MEPESTNTFNQPVPRVFGAARFTRVLALIAIVAITAVSVWIWSQADDPDNVKIGVAIIIAISIPALSGVVVVLSEELKYQRHHEQER